MAVRSLFGAEITLNASVPSHLIIYNDDIL
jgi:hypothetical protein